MLDEAAVESNELALPENFSEAGLESARKLYQAPRCRHVSPSGRQCRLSQTSKFGYCSKHLDEALAAEAEEGQALAQQLMGNATDFKSAISVNDFVRKALQLFIEKRISSRDAHTLIRFAQLLVCTLRPIENEYRAAGGLDAWANMLYEKAPAGTLPNPGEEFDEDNSDGDESGSDDSGAEGTEQLDEIADGTGECAEADRDGMIAP